MSVDHTEEVRDRLNEVIPSHYVLSSMSRDEIAFGVRIAFGIMGYIPKDLENSFEKSWEFFSENPSKFQGNSPENPSKSQDDFSQKSSTKNPENSDVSLSEFVYRVWRCDNGLS